MNDLNTLASLPAELRPRLLDTLNPAHRPVVLEIALTLLAEDADSRTFDARFVETLRVRVEEGDDELRGVLMVVTGQMDTVADLRNGLLALRHRAEVYSAITRLLPTPRPAQGARR